MTEFEAKLTYKINEAVWQSISIDEAAQQITKLVADTVLKAIGEQKKINIFGYQSGVTKYGQESYNQALDDLKSNILKELGIKEK